jgi:hypothetical protein
MVRDPALLFASTELSAEDKRSGPDYEYEFLNVRNVKAR